mmetsp:Transcript_7356/g.25319  ORF Transcript_7356/g.25319 Transcript_7356/m.25319 type:complete len:124 (-) Transcript_7356:94-465(-)
MPRYYCDYCDAYLTHDSASVRKQHVTGFKHKANVRAYYALFEQQLCIHEEQIRAREFQQSRRQAIQAPMYHQFQQQFHPAAMRQPYMHPQQQQQAPPQQQQQQQQQQQPPPKEGQKWSFSKQT